MGELAAAQAFGVGFTNTVGVVTPTFHQVFRPGKLRTVFAIRKRRKLKAHIMPLESNILKKLQLRKQSREGAQCCAASCIQNASGDFLQQVAKLQQAWTVIP